MVGMQGMVIERDAIQDNDVFETIIGNLPDIIHSVDESGNIIYTNRVAEQLLGYSHGELLAMNVRELYAHEVLDDLECGFTNLMHKGDQSVESIIVAKDGSHIAVELRSFSVYDDDGHFVQTYSILRDMRKLKSLQEGLGHTMRLASIGEFTSGIAHDINNPLALICVCCDMIRDIIGDECPKERMNEMKEYVTDMGQASRSIEKLSRKMLEFSRVVSDCAEMVDLGGVVQDGLFLLGGKMKDNRITVHHDIHLGRCLVKGVGNKLEQIFVNLIGNACDAMAESDARDLTITVLQDNYKGRECWRCDVTDTGVGIPPDKHKMLFASFFTTKPTGKGIGLGLSISRGIARDHEGDITVRSDAGKGTTFSVFLPVLDPESVKDLSGYIVG
jgi:PAS domain S-box-containing protein